MKKLNFRTRIMWIVGSSCVLCSSLSILVSIYFGKEELAAGIIEKAQTIHSRLEAATEYVALQGGLSSEIKKFKEAYSSDDQMTKEDKEQVLKQVPIFAAMKIGEKDSQNERYLFRVFSNEPRKKENLANGFEKTVYDKFLKDKSLKQYVHNDGEVITVFKPVRLSEKQGCLTCHGDPKLSPWNNGKDILGYPMENWEDGRLHGVFAISSNIDEIKALRKTDEHTRTLILFGMLPIIGVVFIAYLLIKTPLANVVHVANRLQKVTDGVGGASKEVNENASNLSQSTTEQSASIQQTSASLEEVESMLRRTTENAQNASAVSASSQSKARDGQEVVARMNDAMS